MSLKQSLQAIALAVVPSAAGATDLIPIFGDFPLNGVALAAGDIIEMVPLPAGYVPVDVILDSDDLDSNGSPTLALDVGFLSQDWTLNDGTSTMTADFISASSVAQAGGIARMSVAGATRIAPVPGDDRAIGIKVHTAPATGATTGSIRLTVMARPQIEGV